MVYGKIKIISLITYNKEILCLETINHLFVFQVDVKFVRMMKRFISLQELKTLHQVRQPVTVIFS